MYTEAYYTDGAKGPQNTFSFSAQTLPRAQAILEMGAVPPGGHVLDYGCGLGALTAAFNRLECSAIGVELSPYAVANALPEAEGYVQALGAIGLDGFGDASFDLAVAKDVFEHIAEPDILRLSSALLRVARKLLLIIPTVGEDGRFIFNRYEQDPTHVTRLTRAQWLALFSQSGIAVQECPELTPKVRRPDKVAGTLCVLLSQST